MRSELAALSVGVGWAAAALGCVQASRGAADGVSVAPPAVCGSCHLAPPADATLQEYWPSLIRLKNSLVERYGLGTSLTPDEVRQALSYYDQHAAPALAVLPPIDAPSPLSFEGTEFGLKAYPMPEGPPAVAGMEIGDLDQDGSPDVLLADVRRHVVGWVRPVSDRWAETELAPAGFPGAVTAIDVDADGVREVAVADLGSIAPTDDPVGSILLLRATPIWGDGDPAVERLVDAVAPVVGVRAADWDGDGDTDLLFATRGRFAGEIGWLENNPGGFIRRPLLSRNGVEGIEVGDLDGDQRVDLVAIVGQEHEEILGFFSIDAQPRRIYRARHPLFSLSAATIVDLDRDGDRDVVFTNGNTLRAIDRTPKPYHGVHWLENRDGKSFEHHSLAGFYSACGVSAGDLDGDGDIDIAATSIRNDWRVPGRPSLIWLENDGHQGFSVHPLAARPTTLASAAVADLTGDGRPDILAAGLNVLPPYAFSERVRLWTNQGRVP